MTIQEYLDGLAGRLREPFRDTGRQMSMADQDTVYAVVTQYASEHRELPRQPYDAENNLSLAPE